jgi:hypothetical protein
MRIAESKFTLAVVHPVIRGFGLGELHMSQIRKGGRIHRNWDDFWHNFKPQKSLSFAV